MSSLRAVEPNRLRILDTDSVGQDIRCSAEGSVGRHEAGEESVCLVGHDVLDGYARVVKGRLDDGVVLHPLLAYEYYALELYGRTFGWNWN